MKCELHIMCSLVCTVYLLGVAPITSDQVTYLRESESQIVGSLFLYDYTLLPEHMFVNTFPNICLHCILYNHFDYFLCVSFMSFIILLFIILSIFILIIFNIQL